MACACKQRKAAGQVTAVKQVAKQPIVSSHSVGTERTNESGSAITATTAKRNVVKRIMFKRHA
jgi:hypothetical protein